MNRLKNRFQSGSQACLALRRLGLNSLGLGLENGFISVLGLDCLAPYGSDIPQLNCQPSLS
jgi:hypothetical protein